MSAGSAFASRIWREIVVDHSGPMGQRIKLVIEALAQIIEAQALA